MGFAFFARSNRQEDAENPTPMINSDIAADTGTVRCGVVSVSEKQNRKITTRTRGEVGRGRGRRRG